MTVEFRRPGLDWGFEFLWMLSMAGLWWLIEYGITGLNRPENSDTWTRKDRIEYYEIRSLCVLAFAALALAVLGLVLWALFPGFWLMAAITGAAYAVLTGVYHLDAALRYKHETAPPVT